MEFTDKQKLDIAEFIFGNNSGTLIKREAESLIKVFQDHRVAEAFVANLDIDDCIDLLLNNTTLEERDLIMQSYYSGKL